MEQRRKTRWEGNEHWFKFDHKSGLQRFNEFKSLNETATAIALRSLKYQLEDNFGLEITDDLFVEIFRKVCGINPVPALGAYAQLEFIQPFEQILEKHGVSKKKIIDIWRTFRFRIDNPRCYKHLLLHIPHSSSSFPSESKYTWNDLDSDERLLIDYYTDELFVPEEKSDKIDSIIFPYCRLYCDVERLVNDPLEADGLGICYFRKTRTGNGYGYKYHFFNSHENAFNIYSDYHSLVAKKLFGAGEGTLLIDCHSFSSLPNLLNSNPPDIDICIGYNNDETCPNEVVIGNIVQYFNSLGYRVGVNTPFSNSKTFNVPLKYHSVMIEVNKSLYMGEYSLMKDGGFDKLKRELQALYSILLKP